LKVRISILRGQESDEQISFDLRTGISIREHMQLIRELQLACIWRYQ
jgi:hypothetical protein